MFLEETNGCTAFAIHGLLQLIEDGDICQQTKVGVKASLREEKRPFLLYFCNDWCRHTVKVPALNDVGLLHQRVNSLGPAHPILSVDVAQLSKYGFTFILNAIQQFSTLDWSEVLLQILFLYQSKVCPALHTKLFKPFHQGSQGLKKKRPGRNDKTASLISRSHVSNSRPAGFVKDCMVKFYDIMCPEKRQAFLNVSLSRNTVADCVCDLATDLKQQLMGKGKYFVAYSLAVDESSDTSDTAQLSIFIRGVDSTLCVTEELLGLKSMHGTTTGKDLFEEVSKCIDEMGLPWDKLVGLTTDGVPAMCVKKNGLVGRIREKMREDNAGELTAYHCIKHQESLCGKALEMDHVLSGVTQAVNFIRARGLNHRQFKSFLDEFCTEYGDVPYHTEVRWLSRGRVLNRCFELREEICQFMESKGKDTTELRDQTFLCELAFMGDIVSHLNALRCTQS